MLVLDSGSFLKLTLGEGLMLTRRPTLTTFASKEGKVAQSNTRPSSTNRRSLRITEYRQSSTFATPILRPTPK